MYVLDTNSLIYFFKGMGRVAESLLATPPQQIAIPAIVLYELEYGIARSSSPKKRRQQLAELCALVKVLPFDQDAARHSATIRVRLEKKGTPVGPHDLMIAGTALACRGVLVTSNTREFARVPGLSVQNWF